MDESKALDILLDINDRLARIETTLAHQAALPIRVAKNEDEIATMKNDQARRLGWVAGASAAVSAIVAILAAALSRLV